MMVLRVEDIATAEDILKKAGILADHRAGHSKSIRNHNPKKTGCLYQTAAGSFCAYVNVNYDVSE